MKHLFITFILLISVHRLITAQSSWSITGNSGTNPPTNFLGTTDSKALVFKTNGSERMRIASNGRVGIGVTSPAYKLDVAGDINISSGKVLRVNGVTALKDNGTSIAIGDNAGQSGLFGTHNTAVGNSSMFTNNGGYSNTAIGEYSMYSNTSGIQNFAAGNAALYSSSVGNNNTAVGAFALYSTTSSSNTAVGAFALEDNAGGGSNSALGMQALTNNSTGNSNSAMGSVSLYTNTSGAANTAGGNSSLYANSSGSYNTGFGFQAGYSGDNNNCTFIGAYAGNTSGSAITNSTALGYQTYLSADNQVRVGNGNVTSIGGVVDWSMVSDQRVKKDIQQNVPGLDFINKLQPVTYNLNLDALDQFMNSGSKTLSAEDQKSKQEKERIVYTGFIAQDVEAAAKQIGFNFSGVDAPKNENDLYGLRYAEFVVPLVKAVQELSQQNDELQKEVEELKSSIVNNESPMTNGFTKLQTSDFKSQTILGQNIPNPFDNSTLIPFRIPKDCKDASIMITNTSTSEVISVVPISCNEDHVSIDAGTLASGTYSYTLYVDGKVIDTKEMILNR